MFQHPKFKRCLAIIISHCTPYAEDYVYNNLTFINTELPKENINERKKVTDLVAYIEDNMLNLECNGKNNTSLIKKNNLYHHKLAYIQASKGKDIEVKDIYQINFNVVSRFDDRLVITFSLIDDENKFVDEENFKRIQINLSQAMKKYYNKDKLSKFEKILVMMQLTSIEEMEKLAGKDEDLMAMKEFMGEINVNGVILPTYDKEMLEEMMRRDDIAEAKQQGEEQKGIDIAKSMMKDNIPVETISKYTGLDKEIIEKL